MRRAVGRRRPTRPTKPTTKYHRDGPDDGWRPSRGTSRGASREASRTRTAAGRCVGNETSPVRCVLDDVSDDATDDETDDAREFYPLIFLRSARARAIAGSSTDDVKRRTTSVGRRSGAPERRRRVSWMILLEVSLTNRRFVTRDFKPTEENQNPSRRGGRMRERAFSTNLIGTDRRRGREARTTRSDDGGVNNLL